MVLVRAQTVTGTTDFAATRFLWGPAAQIQHLGNLTVDTLALSDADNSVAAVFMIDRDGTIDGIWLNNSAKTGSDATVKYWVGVVTVDASGLPTTTPYGGSALLNPTQASLSSGGQWLTLATPATAVCGDLAAVRIWHDDTSTLPTTANVTVRRSVRIGNTSVAYALPYEANFQTAWAKNGHLPLLGYRYSDGIVGPLPVNAGSTVLSSSFNTGTTPDEIGAKLQLPWGAVCRGARLQVDAATIATNAFVARLYDAADAVVASATVPAATLASAVLSNVDVYWDAVTLTANTDYRLTLLPTTTDNTQLGVIAAPDTASKEAIGCGDTFGLTHRTDAGAWTDTPNTVPLVGLWLAGVA